MPNRVSFNKAPVVGGELELISQSLSGSKISGDGHFGIKCQCFFEDLLGASKVLLTPSCTAALELAALLANIGPGDEVIMPSFTFASTANAFVLRGASIVFVDIRTDTLNIDERKIESAITERTRVIVPVHYAGVSCDMDVIMSLANRYGLIVVEDAAQAVMSKYQNRYVGTRGQFAAFSFHETKNFTSGGEGGALIINDESFVEQAEIFREKGTNRVMFFRGNVDKYTWVSAGSSYLPGELQAAHLYAQLLKAEKITTRRVAVWNEYHTLLATLAQGGQLVLPQVPEECSHNGHIFHIRCENEITRNELLSHLNQRGIGAVFHYLPLHSAPAGLKYGRFLGEDNHTTSESSKLLRLPLFYNIGDLEVKEVADTVLEFFGTTSGNEISQVKVY